MQRYYFLKTILVLMFLALPLSLPAMEYQHNLEAEHMQFSWSIDTDQIHVRLTAKTSGWVGIGFDPENAMSGANIIIGAVNNGSFTVEDHYADRKTGHVNDEKAGGVNDVLNPSGSEENGVTVISFSLLLNTGDKYDKQIDPDGTTKVMLACGGEKDSFKLHHPFRYIYDVNLLTGENKKIK